MLKYYHWTLFPNALCSIRVAPVSMMSYWPWVPEQVRLPPHPRSSTLLLSRLVPQYMRSWPPAVVRASLSETQVKTTSSRSPEDDAPKGDVPRTSQKSEVSTAGDDALPEYWHLLQTYCHMRT